MLGPESVTKQITPTEKVKVLELVGLGVDGQGARLDSRSSQNSDRKSVGWTFRMSHR